MELDLAVIVMFGGNFAMAGYAFCNGTLLSIAQNSALFSILGTTFGGDGQTTFALPDLRGRVPIHSGSSTGPGLSPYVLGQMSGTEGVTLTINQMPQHNHSLNVNVGGSNSLPGSSTSFAAGTPTGSGPNASILNYYTTAAPNISINPNTVGFTGGNQPHPNLQPYLAVNFVIALQGIFPTRN